MSTQKSEHKRKKDKEGTRPGSSAPERDWPKEYFQKVYGLKSSAAQSAQNEPNKFEQHSDLSTDTNELLLRLLDRFNDLDIAPCDGFISMAEIELAINNPRYYFDENDRRMLLITKRYFNLIGQVCSKEDPERDLHEGLSRKDLEMVVSSQSQRSDRLRKHLAQEFSQPEQCR